MCAKAVLLFFLLGRYLAELCRLDDDTVSEEPLPMVCYLSRKPRFHHHHYRSRAVCRL